MKSTILAIAALLAATAPVSAHAASLDIRLGVGTGYAYPDTRIDWVCSGRRAAELEGRLGQEEHEGDIDGYTADRIHAEIDRVEDKQRHECREGDWGGVRSVASRYDRIDEWISREAHGRRWDW